MQHSLEIARLAEETMKSQRFLHPMLFDIKGRIYEDMRQKLLTAANFFIDKSIKNIQSLEVKDIILCGSFARYLYNEKSDLDLKVLVAAKEGGCIQNSEKAINDLLSMIAVNYFGNKIYLKINGIPLDIKFEAKFDDFLGYYSLMENKWIIMPQKDPAAEVNIDNVIKGYFRKLADINRFMASLPMANGAYSPEEIEKMNLFFNELNHPGLNAEDYFIYRVLCKSGKMQEFGADCVFAATDSFSLE